MAQKFGWMEHMELLALSVNQPENIHLLIIPTVLIPLTLVSMGISVAATFIAGLFGVSLKAEGPKRLLELILKPRLIIGALVLNSAIIGGTWFYRYIKNMPSFLYTIERKNAPTNERTSAFIYPETFERKNSFSYSDKLTPVLSPTLVAQTKVKGGIFRAGVLSDQSILFGTSEGRIHELSQNDLIANRELFIGTFVSPAPIIWKNYLISGEGLHDTHHARIYFFDLKTGQLAKSFSTKGHTEGQPVMAHFEDKYYLLIAAGKDGVYAIDPKDLSVKWQKIDGHVDASFIVEGRSVYVGTGREKGNKEDFRSYALSYDLISGKINWKRELPASNWMKPAIAGTNVCFSYGEVYFASELGGIDCFDKESGLPTQSHRSLTPISSTPLVVGNDLYYANDGGEVCRIDTETKASQWCFDTKSETSKSFSSVIYDPYRNVIIYPSKKKGIFVLSPKDGKLLATWLPQASETPWATTYGSVAVTERYWFIGDMEGNVRKLDPVGKSVANVE